MADPRDVDHIAAELQKVIAQRSAMSLRITVLEMALGPWANLADEIIEQKGKEWADDYGALPVHMLYVEAGRYTMPRIEHCLRAKHLAEGGD